MDDLRAIMQIVDEHSNVLPEGAYLDICQRMRRLYNNKENAMTRLFDYEQPIVSLHANPDERSDVDEYFERIYYAAALTNDIDFLENQLTYLVNLKEEVEPMKRVSKYTKMFCVKHYCKIHNINIDEYNPVALKKYCETNNVHIGKRGEEFEKAFARVCRSYKVIENRFRRRTRENIDAKIEQIENWIEDIYDIT
jgi:hypothetical protein